MVLAVLLNFSLQFANPVKQYLSEFYGKESLHR